MATGDQGLNSQSALTWLGSPEAHDDQYGVYLFRTRMRVATDGTMRLAVSADSRYELFVNGIHVATGPARGDLHGWWFDRVDLSGYLRSGQNAIAAIVWFPGPDFAPWSQLMYAPALAVGSDDEELAAIMTPVAWQVARSDAWGPILEGEYALRNHQPVGCRDRFMAGRYPWGWTTFEEKAGRARWYRAVPVAGPWQTREWATQPVALVETDPSPVRRATVEEGLPILAGREIASERTESFLLDRGYLTNGYPSLTISGGADAQIILIYAEALVDGQTLEKGDRNRVDGYEIRGVHDEFFPDGGDRRTFRPLWFRTYRYVEIRVRAAHEPLVIDDWREEWTGYPLGNEGMFRSDDSQLDSVWRVGRWTLSCCTWDSFMDCPYYERLQYVGDTRIQALIMLYSQRNDDLIRKAIDDFAGSRRAAATLPDGRGLTTQRYPARLVRLIPTFSLFWVGMLHDLWLHRASDEFVAGYLHAADEVLAWFESRRRSDGLVGALPGMAFVDWTAEWPWDPHRAGRPGGGEPPGAREGGGATVSLLFAIAAGWLADLHEAWEPRPRAGATGSFTPASPRLCARPAGMVNKVCSRTAPGSGSYSQHTNILAVLADAVTGERARELMRRVTADDGLVRASYYFRFYLFEALDRCGLGARVVDEAVPWKRLLDQGFTTFPEILERGTRSDCHAWSASPTYELPATVVGVRPGAQSFATVEIAPHPGPLHRLTAQVPHPRGIVDVSLRVGDSGELRGTISLPPDTPGRLRWRGTVRELAPGSTVHL